MKKAITWFLSLAFAASLNAQISGVETAAGSPIPPPPYTYGNEWYDPAQNYFKLLVDQDAVYRVTLADLLTANVNTIGMNPSNLHLIYRGEEQPMYVNQTGGILNYFEFIGRKNDGRVDSLLYRNPENQFGGGDLSTNIYRSLFTDTSAYFVYWDAQPGLRFSEFSDTTNYSSFTPEPWFRAEVFQGNTSMPYQNGSNSPHDEKHFLNSEYTPGEGYGGQVFLQGQQALFIVPIPGVANSGNPNELNARLHATTAETGHIRKVTINNLEIARDTVDAFDIRTLNAFDSQSYGIPFIYLRFIVENSGPGGLFESRVFWFNFRYDRFFNLGNVNSTRVVEWGDTADSYLCFTNVLGDSQCVMYDATTQTRIEGSFTGDSAKFIVPGSAVQDRELLMASNQGLLTPVVLNYTRLNNYSDPQVGAEFIIITHRKLDSVATNYKNYRENSPVNAQSSVVVFTDEIYDEFGYGSHTPLAIRNFLKYALDNWQTKPKYVLLLGHAHGYHRYFEGADLVPTWGMPPSDFLLVSNFYPDKREYTPRIPIGRVSVSNNTQGQAYLDKVIQYEATGHQPWMKETLLLSGGSNPTQQNQLAATMITDSAGGAWRYRLEAPPFSSHVNWARKSNGGLLTSDNISVTEVFNNGVSLFHFFGHSTQTAYELDILNPNQYTNWGRYPFIIAFGCNGGNFTSDVGSSGETFVAEPGRGAIGYLANSAEGWVEPLKRYGTEFYKVLCGTHFGQPIGAVIKETIRQYTLNGADYGRANHARQMNLQGDPSLKIALPTKPDLSIASSDIYLSPASFSSQDNQFTLNAVLHNTGSFPADSFRVSVKHFSPAGNIYNYPSQWFHPFSIIDTFSISFLNPEGPAIAGQNTFEVTVDTGNVIDEYFETNNVAQLNVLIPGNSPAVLFPPAYAIIPDNQVFLAASAYVITNQPTLSYIFEIDTSSRFDSPFKINSGPVAGTTVYCSWNVPFTLQDSGVYYWRVRLENVWPANWSTSSFRHIQGLRGWTQCRQPQFVKDETDRIILNELNQEWVFENYEREFHAWVEYTGIPRYQLHGFTGEIANAGIGGIRYTPIRKKDLVPAIQNTPYGDWTFLVMPDGQTELITSIQNTPNGDYFLIASSMDPNLSTWSAATKSSLALIGVDVTAFSALPPGSRFIIFGRKGGSPGSAIFLNAPFGSTLDYLTYLSGTYFEGTIQSTLIGPAVDWNEMKFNWGTKDNFPGDSLEVSVYGVRQDFSDSLLIQNLQEGSHLIDFIPAGEYPFLRMVARAKDFYFQTAPQLEEWTVTYEAAPDAALDPTINYSFNRDTVSQGEDVSVSMAVRNLTPTPMDSLWIQFRIQRLDRTVILLDSIRTAPLGANAIQNFSFSFNTAQYNLSGTMDFVAEVNPGPEEIEMYYFNNTWFHRFNVETDQIHPLLDVTFNGKHIMDGDIVSSEPEIRIEVNDENQWLPIAVNDTTFEVEFGPGRSSSLLVQVPMLGNPMVEILPVEMPQNKSAVIFKPGRLEDGEYTLRVQGRDNSGNTSGNSYYEVHFNVVNEKSISHVLNYPNPFSSSTKFVYTLTGNEIPEQFEIRIYTITGKLVKVIDLHAEGEVFFGNNVTQYAWDGRDDYGDLLANGVYIYEVATRFASREEVKNRDIGVDEFFKNGFGKLYILR